MSQDDRQMTHEEMLDEVVEATHKILEYLKKKGHTIDGTIWPVVKVMLAAGYGGAEKNFPPQKPQASMR